MKIPYEYRSENQRIRNYFIINEFTGLEEKITEVKTIWYYLMITTGFCLINKPLIKIYFNGKRLKDVNISGIFKDYTELNK